MILADLCIELPVFFCFRVLSDIISQTLPRSITHGAALCFKNRHFWQSYRKIVGMMSVIRTTCILKSMGLQWGLSQGAHTMPSINRLTTVFYPSDCPQISLCATPAFFAGPERLFHLELILNICGGQNGDVSTDLNISTLSMQHFTRVHPQFTPGSIPICRDWV